MKKAIALGVLLGASFISFAFAQVTVVNRVVDVISAGQPIKFDKNGEQLIIHNLQKHLVSIEFNFSSEYLSGHIGVVEYPPYTTNTYEIWISKTPGGTPLPGFEKMTTNGLGGPIEFKHPSLKALGGRYAIPGMFKYLDHGKYYYNLLPSDPTYSAVAHTLRTASMSSQDEVKVFSPSTISNTLPVSKRWDDFVTTLTTRVTVDLSGTQVGAVAFGSWRYYAGTPADLDMLSVTATPAFTYPVGMVDLVVSPIEGSFTPISPECSLQTEQTLALGRNATMMRFTTKKFEELTEAQKRLGYCILQPDTKYYMNVRFVNKNGETTCTKDRCGIYIDVNYSGAINSTTASCSLLSKSLAVGSKDALTGGEVTKLQTFLQGSYLSVSPTGYYGNMTSAAVKSFQGAYGISQLGIVGPATRAKINELHCSGTALTTPIVQNTDENKTTPTPSYQGGSGVNVSSPFAGQFVKNESTKTAITTITWEQTIGAKADIATIDLYDAGGSYIKTIAQNTSNSGSYVWRYDPTLENGTYKIVVKVGSLSGESGVFTIGMASFVATNPITVNPVVTTTSASDDYDILGRVIPTPTGPAGATMCEGMGGNPSPGSGSGPCGSYEIPVGNCSSGMTGENAITRAWQYNLENSLYLRKGNSIRFSLQRDHAMVFRFKTGASGEYTFPSPIQFAYDEHTANGPAYTRFTSLSEQKCDFDYNKLYIPNTPLTETVNNCFQSETYTGALLGMVTATGNDIVPGNITKNFPKCQLKPNTYYYVNVRWEKAVTSSSRGQISCPVGNNAQNVCGTVIGAN